MLRIGRAGRTTGAGQAAGAGPAGDPGRTGEPQAEAGTGAGGRWSGVDLRDGAPRTPSAPRRRRLPRVLLVLGPLLLVAALVLVGTSMQSPMAIRSVTVTGAAADLEPAVRTAAGVAPGASFASLDPAAVADRVASIEGVRSADLRWSRWNVLEIAVVEHRVVAAEAAPEGGAALLDESGATVRLVPAAPPGVVLIAAQGDGRDAALALAAALPDGWPARIGRVVAQGPRALSLELVSGQRVVLGDTTELDRKLALAEALAATGAQGIDVSVPQRPALRDLPAPPTSP